MKKYLLVILILITTCTLAQVPNNELNKFVGTWQWVSGSDTFIIVLQKQIVTMPSGFINEDLVGWHKYVRNGQLIQSSLQNIGLSFNAENIPLGNDLEITLYGFNKTPTQIWFERLWDLTLHKNCFVYFTMLPNSNTQASWKITNNRGSRYTGPPGTYNQFTLPRDIVLTKQ